MLGIAFGASLLAAGASLRFGGYANRGGPLADWERVVSAALLARLCAPDAADAPSVESVGAPAFVARYVSQMPEATRTELRAFLLLVEHAAPTLAGVSAHRWSLLRGEEQDEVLAWLGERAPARLSSAFSAVKSLFFMAYYRAPATWAMIGYDGPKVAGEPETP